MKVLNDVCSLYLHYRDFFIEKATWIMNIIIKFLYNYMVLRYCTYFIYLLSKIQSCGEG